MALDHKHRAWGTQGPFSDSTSRLHEGRVLHLCLPIYNNIFTGTSFLQLFNRHDHQKHLMLGINRLLWIRLKSNYI